MDNNSIEAKHVKKPEKAIHDAEVAKVQNEIKKSQERTQVLRNEMEAIQTGRSGFSEQIKEAKALYSELNNKKQLLHTERQQLKLNLDKIKKDKDSFHVNQKAMKSELKFNSIEDIEKEIANLHHQQSTKSMSLNEEKKIIKAIEALQQSKKLVAKYAAEQGNGEKHVASMKDIRAEMDAKSEEINKVTEQFNKQKKIMDDLRAASDAGGRDEYPKLLQERKELKTHIDSLFEKIREFRTQFKEDNDKYFNAVRAAREAKKLQRDQEEQARKEDYEAKLAEYENEMAKIHPYQDEIDLCTALVIYLEKTYSKDLAKKNASTDKKSQTASVELDGLKPLKRDEDVYFIGGGKNNKKQNKASKSKKEATIVLPMAQLESFATINLMPPTSVTNVADSIAAVKTKKEWFHNQNEKKSNGSVTSAENGNHSAPSSPKKKSNKNKKFDSEDASAFPSLGDLKQNTPSAAWGPNATVSSVEETTEEVVANDEEE